MVASAAELAGLLGAEAGVALAVSIGISVSVLAVLRCGSRFSGARVQDHRGDQCHGFDRVRAIARRNVALGRTAVPFGDPKLTVRPRVARADLHGESILSLARAATPRARSAPGDQLREGVIARAARWHAVVELIADGRFRVLRNCLPGEATPAHANTTSNARPETPGGRATRWASREARAANISRSCVKSAGKKKRNCHGQRAD